MESREARRQARKEMPRKIASYSLSSAVRGRPIQSFLVERISFMRLIIIPVFIAFWGPIILWVCSLSILQVMQIIPPGRSYEHERSLILQVLYVLGAPSLLLAFGLPVWFRHPLRIEIFENGLSYREEFFLWEEFEAVNVTTTITKINCQLCLIDGRVFSITKSGPMLIRLVHHVRERTAPVFLSRLAEQFKTDGKVNFGNIWLSRSNIQQNSYQLDFHDIAEIIHNQAGQCVLICHKNGLNRMVIMLEGVSNGHLLLPFLRDLMSPSQTSV